MNLMRDVLGQDELNQTQNPLEKATVYRPDQADQGRSNEDLTTAIKTEKQIMLVINELCSRLVPFESGKDRSKEIDLIPVAESLSECNLSVKQTQRCWEQFKKRLRDV